MKYVYKCYLLIECDGGNKMEFKNNLKNLGIEWNDSPTYDKIKKIKARIIIGPNGCGKSRLLCALSKTLIENKVRKTDIMYADFPEMAGLERKGIKDNELTLLNDIFIDRRNTPIYDTLKLISSDPIKGVNSLISLSETDPQCKDAVINADEFLKPMFGSAFTLAYIAEYFGTDKPLSPGQRSMFYMSVMLGVLAAHHKDDEFYILLDEPDQHLHAKSIVDFVKQIQNNLPKAKLWIATHSVHLMTHFKFDEIIYIESSKVRPNNSKMYDEICKSIVDTDDMQQFVSYAGLYGFYEFFRECFTEPEAEGNINKENFTPLQQRVRDLNIQKILDYGAGKGRFYKLLSDIPNLQYNAFECFPKYHKELDALINTGSLYTKASDIPEGEFDAVLLINTLHEIPIDEWSMTFQTIKRILKDEGYLLFCETVPLVTGEKIMNTGFLVLGTLEQQALFDVESVFLDNAKKLHFTQVPKNIIPFLSKNHLEHILNVLMNNTYKSWDKEDKSARNSAFYAVQHLNAKKAIAQLVKIVNVADDLAKKQKNIDMEPNSAAHWYALGEAFHELGRYDSALVAKQQAVKMELMNANYYNSLGETLFIMGRYDDDIDAMKKAVELEPENAEFHASLGISLHKMKRYDEALFAIQKAIELEPINVSYRDDLDRTLREMKRYDEAFNAK